MLRLLAVAAALALVAAPGCKGKTGEKAGTDQPKPVEGKVPTETTAPPPEPAPPPVNDPPTMELPAYDIVGVGQEIGFGIEVVDEESDEITVELVSKPESATWDPYTLTVVWKPTAADIPHGSFTAKITEKRRDTGEVRAFTHAFSIAVSRRAQPMPLAKPLGPAVETLITIHDPARLAEANKQWPLDKMLEAAAQSAHRDLPEAEAKAAAVADKKKLYESFLHSLARAHHNPSVDPASDRFDAKTWGNPADWSIIAIRPRLDKKWHEVRIIYKAKAHAATYTMFKFRPLAHEKHAKTGLAANNKAMAQLVVDAFFTEGGELSPALFSDKVAHAKKVAEFLGNVVNYKNGDEPSVTFLGLPTEARLGGGNKRDAEGNYVSGDAWGWNVMKAKVKEGAVVMKNVPIKGFATHIAASEDKSEWQMRCAPIFDPKSDAHDPRFGKLCRDSGHVDLPGTGDGYAEAKAGDDVVPSLVDAANLFIDHKTGPMVATIPLLDPRRDLFEEKGMTCSQCHVRKFGVRDYYDKAATDPRAGEPRALNKSQDTTYFVIVPVERWQPYAVDFQHKQECKIKAAIKKALGLETSLTCPLKAN